MSVAATSAVRRPARPGFDPRSLRAFVLPLYFILLMSATLVTALHAPTPHDLAVTIAGDGPVASSVATGVERGGDGRFAITRADTAAEARTAVLQRTAVGAVVVGGSSGAPSVTTFVASGGGRSAASAVEALGSSVAAQLHTTVTVQDLAPLVPADSLGTGTFYLVVFTSIAGYLTLIVLTQVVPRVKLRTRYLTAVLAAIAGPVLVYGLASIFLQGFGIAFGSMMGVLGVLALYTFTVALIVILAEQLVGRAAIFLVAPVAIFLNLASAGGASPESMLPGFWQALHSVWFGAGAQEAIRDIVYFPGADPLRWIVQLLLWTLALIAATVVVEGVKVIWRLQSILIRSQRHAESLAEHIHLLAVPRQQRTRPDALTSSAPAAVSSDPGTVPPRAEPAVSDAPVVGA